MSNSPSPRDEGNNRTRRLRLIAYLVALGISVWLIVVVSLSAVDNFDNQTIRDPYTGEFVGPDGGHR